MSPPLKLHSFLSKTTIHRSPPPLGPYHLTKSGLQPTPHYLAPITLPTYALTHRPWPQSPNLSYSPIDAPPLGPNHPTTCGPQSTHHSYSPIDAPPLGPNHPITFGNQSTHHTYAPTHPSPTTSSLTNPPPLTQITPPPLGTNPSPLGPNYPSTSTSSSSSASTSFSFSASANSSTRELEIIEKFLCPHHLSVHNLVVVECPHHLTCHHHWSRIHFWAK